MQRSIQGHRAGRFGNRDPSIAAGERLFLNRPRTSHAGRHQDPRTGEDKEGEMLLRTLVVGD